MSREDEKFVRYSYFCKVAKAFFDARELPVSDTTVGHLALLLQQAENKDIPAWIATQSDYKGYKEL